MRRTRDGLLAVFENNPSLSNIQAQGVSERFRDELVNMKKVHCETSSGLGNTCTIQHET